ncbi:MAG TPA: hypothetical protein VGM50_22400 [Gemmatimonadaceae bacterium]
MPIAIATNGGPPHRTPVDSTEMTLAVVQNDRAVPATIVIEDGNDDYTIGIVAAHADTTLRIPDRVAGDDIKVFVEPQGQLEQSTDAMRIQKGEHLGIVVPSK